MMKRNVMIKTAIASALLAFGVSALAGSISVTKRTVATEAFGSAFNATTPVYIPNTGYVFNTPAGIVVNSGGSVNVVYTMTGGQWSSSGALVAGNAVATAMGGTFTVSAPVASTVTTTNDTLTVTLTNASGANITIGIGGTVTLTSISSGVRYQAIGVTAGTNVTVSGKAMNGTSVLESATAATAIDSAVAIASTFTPSTETKKIDLTVVPAGSALTAGIAGANLVQLGKIAFTATAGTKTDLDVSATLGEATIAPGAPAFSGAFTVTVAPSTGTFTAKQGVQLYTGSTCIGTLAGGAPTQAPLLSAVTAATASVVISSNVAETQANSATDLAGVFVCSDYSGVTAGTVISEFKPTISASYTKASTSYTGATLAANTGYNLTNNGATVVIRNYIPAAVAGYQQTVRLINTGTISAQASVSLIDDATGIATAAVPVGAVMAPGSSQRLSQATIEAALGSTLSANVRPRLKFTAPTSAMEGQSFFNNANGAYTNLSGIE